MAHYYTPTGELIDGLRAARKHAAAYPSPSTILSMLGSEGLMYYFKRQMFEAAVTTPKQEGWNDDMHFDACMKSADEHSQIARDKGISFHEFTQNLHRMHAGKTGGELPPVGGMEEQCRLYANWFSENVAEVLAVEQFVFGGNYGGTMDLGVKLKDGRIAVVDTKTQGLKGKKKFNFYSKWALQLGAYQKGWAMSHGHHAVTLISVAVSSDSPMVEAFHWPKLPGYYSDLFQCALRLWQDDNEYYPSAQNSITPQPQKHA